MILNYKKIKYDSSGSIRFDFFARIKCWFLYKEHYFMTPSDDVQSWCGVCGKLDNKFSKKLTTLNL